jgi:hypothetical protein
MVKFKFKVKGQFTGFMGLGGGEVFLILPTLLGGGGPFEGEGVPPPGGRRGPPGGNGGGAANGSMGMAGGGVGRLITQSG